jgi:hypothetical protein
VPHGLLEVPVAMLSSSVAAAADVRSLVGVAAAFLAAVLAAYASWYITDRVISRRQRADQDEF